MKNYDKNIISSYLIYVDANNLYCWGMSQKLPVNGFKLIKKLFTFDEDLIKNYDKNSNKGYILEVDVEYPKHLFSFHKDLPFLAERKKIEKCKKLVSNIHDKEIYVVHIRALKKPLDHGLILQKVQKVIQFNQETRLKPYSDMNTKLKIVKNDFEKEFFKLMHNAVFGKAMENVRRNRDIKLVTTDNQLA